MQSSFRQRPARMRISLRGTLRAALAGMQNPKYDRDNLVNLLAERATFERSAVTLYDALLSAIEDVEHPLLVSSMDDVRRHRDEEEQHAIWTEELLAKLGGRPQRELSDAVNREARALGDIIQRGRRSA